MWARSLGWEDPLEEGMATHSSTLAWKTLWTEEPGRPETHVLRVSDAIQPSHLLSSPSPLAPNPS